MGVRPELKMIARFMARWKSYVLRKNDIMSPRTSTHQASRLKYIETIFFCLLRPFKVLLIWAEQILNFYDAILMIFHFTSNFPVLDSKEKHYLQIANRYKEEMAEDYKNNSVLAYYLFNLTQ